MIVYKKRCTWVNARKGDQVQVEIDFITVDPYAFAIRVQGKYFDVTKTVKHIPGETS